MRTTLVLGILTPVLACDAVRSVPVRVDRSEVEYQTAPGSGEPNLFVAGDQLWLTWFEPTSAGHALRFAAHRDGSWSEPQTIVADRDFFVNWADFPSLTRLSSGDLVVHWLEKVAPSPYAYHVLLARSADGGRTWSEPMPSHRDLSPREHGFVSMVPLPNGEAGVVWLDGRNTGEDGHAGAMQVRSTTLRADGSLGPEYVVDDRSCDCCQTAMLNTPRGLLVAYRDRSEAEIRDIAVSRFTGDGWTEPYHVGNDDWHFPACPVNGPALAGRGESVAIAWYTAPEQDPHVFLAFSPDAGTTFGEPIRVDEGDALGRVDVELLDDGSAVVAWLERKGEEGRIWARRLSRSGTMDRPFLVTETRPTRRSGFPRMARIGADLVFAWTVVGDEGGIRVARFAGFADGAPE